MLSMRGFIPVCIIIQPESALISRRKIDGFAPLFLNGRRNGEKKRGDNQSLYKIIVEIYNNFKGPSENTS
jgi:hypothetical protein